MIRSLSGEPNSGKSTLINRYLDQNISSVTEHANTTNRNVVGVITDGDTQVVIIDTPGKWRALKMRDLPLRIWTSFLIC